MFGGHNMNQRHKMIFFCFIYAVLGTRPCRIKHRFKLTWTFFGFMKTTSFEELPIENMGHLF